MWDTTIEKFHLRKRKDYFFIDKPIRRKIFKVYSCDLKSSTTVGYLYLCMYSIAKKNGTVPLCPVQFIQ
jgi:hypothetical protein